MNGIAPKIVAIVVLVALWLPIVWLALKGLFGQSTRQLPTMRRVYGKEARISGLIALLAALAMAIAFVVIVATGKFNPRW